MLRSRHPHHTKLEITRWLSHRGTRRDCGLNVRSVGSAVLVRLDLSGSMSARLSRLRTILIARWGRFACCIPVLPGGRSPSPSSPTGTAPFSTPRPGSVRCTRSDLSSAGPGPSGRGMSHRQQAGRRPAKNARERITAGCMIWRKSNSNSINRRSDYAWVEHGLAFGPAWTRGEVDTSPRDVSVECADRSVAE